MKRIVTILLMLGMAIASFAQIEEHVKWTYSVKELNGQEAELVFTGKIDDGWHLYS